MADQDNLRETVLEMFDQGLSSHDIARELGITWQTAAGFKGSLPRAALCLIDEGEDEPRAMLVAKGFSRRLRNAARRAGVELVTYGFSFTFTRDDAGPNNPQASLA